MPDRLRTGGPGTVGGMTQIKRSRRLRAGLAGLSVVSALGAAVGLGLTTHTHSSGQPGLSASGGNRATRTVVRSGEDGRDDGEGSQPSSSTQQSPVTQPSNSAPQATTSGS
jgi:hypothetical protein